MDVYIYIYIYSSNDDMLDYWKQGRKHDGGLSLTGGKMR